MQLYADKLLAFSRGQWRQREWRKPLTGCIWKETRFTHLNELRFCYVVRTWWPTQEGWLRWNSGWHCTVALIFCRFRSDLTDMVIFAYHPDNEFVMKVLVKSGATERLQWCFTYRTTFERKIALMYEIQENLMRNICIQFDTCLHRNQPHCNKIRKVKCCLQFINCNNNPSHTLQVRL